MSPQEHVACQDGALGDVVVLCADEEVRDVVAFWASSLPVRAVVAENGYHAGRILNAGQCRLLITDRILPPWPGLPTFLTLRGRDTKLRIAYVDSGGREERVLARVTGATDILDRPLKRRAVLDVLRPAQSES